MLDLAFIRNYPDIVKEAARVKYNPIDIDYLLEVDRQVLELQRQVEEARADLLDFSALEYPQPFLKMEISRL